eukprot:3155617-Prymnesium_polylepis.1
MTQESDKSIGDINAAAACALHESKSQWGEDLAILPTLLRLPRSRGKRSGVFLEMGALDGITYSNTFMLERCFGWTGFLIEANPINARALQTSGRNATLIQSGVCRPSGAFNMTVGGGMVAGQIGAMSAAHRIMWSKKNANNGTVSVPCQPLGQVLMNSHHGRSSRNIGPKSLGPIDFFSLDVEGAEENVLLASERDMFTAIL